MDYEKELSDLVDRQKKEMRNLNLRYAESVNPVNIGDKLKDHCNQGIVKSWCLSLFRWDKPSLVYICDRLTKNGKPSKRNPVAYIYQSNLKMINGKEYTG